MPVVASRISNCVRLIQRPCPSGSGVVVWTLLEGGQFAEDPESQQEEVRGDGGARGEGLGFFTFERN